MNKLVFTVISAGVLSFGAANFASGDLQKLIGSSTSQPAQNQSVNTIQLQEAKAKPAPLSGIERIKRANNGHYEAEFKFNNTRVQGLIDTGASAIAINETTARRAGIRLAPSDFIYTVNTANGKAKAAKATIDRVQIGSIRISDVEAIVMEDKSLNIVLIGMSFMNRLRGFEYQSGNLVLKR